MHPRTILTAALLGFAALAAAAIDLLAERGGFHFPAAAAVVLVPGALVAWLAAHKLAAALRVPPSPDARGAESPAPVTPDWPPPSRMEIGPAKPDLPAPEPALPEEKGRPAAETGDLLEFERAERKRLERELQEAELRFRSAIHFAPNGVIAADRKGAIQWWNDEAANLFGYAAEEAAGKDLGTLIAQGEREHYHEEMLRFVDTGESTVSNKWVELMGLRKDGSEFPMEVYLQLWSTAEGGFLGLIVHDLSRRRQFEETLRRETARVELMQRVAAAANEAASIEEALQASIDLVCNYSDWAVGHVYLIDLHGQLAPTNLWHLKSREWFEEFRETTIRLGPASAQNLAGRVAAGQAPVWIEDLARESEPRSKAAEEVGLEGAFAFPVSVSNELRAVCEFFSTRARAPDESLFGLATYIGGQIGRVIERKWAEAALQDSDAKYRDLFDEAPVGYYELDASGIIRRVNRTELQMLGFGAEEMLGKPVWEFMVESGARQQVEARLAGEVPLTIREQIYRCRDGGMIPVLAHERLIRDPQENRPGILGTIQNISERKRAEQALRSSEERNRTLLASLPQHVFFKNSDLRFETVNALFAASFGKRPEEIIGKTDYDLFPADLAEKYRADDLRVIETRVGMTTVEMNLVQGQERFVETSKSPVVDSHGKVLGVLGLFADVTERKKADEFRNRLAAIVESSRDAIIGQNPEGAITSWNMGAQAIYGYEPEEVIGQPFSILIPRDMLEAETRFHARVRGGDRVQNIETIHLRKDAARIHVALTVSPIFDAQGAVTGGSVVARDVTEMKEAEEEINRARMLLQSVVEALPLMVFMKSAADLRYVLVNRAAKDLLGFGEEEIVGKTDEDLFPHDQAEIFAGQDRAALASGQLVESEQTIQTRHKGARSWHMRKIPIRGGFGKPEHLLGICEDITERKLAEEKLKLYAFRLEQSNRALQDFASVASHDLQEPLRKVQAFGDRLKTKFAPVLTDEGRDYLQRMQGAAQRMQKLIEDLLAFSRVTSKAQPFVTVDLNEVARDVLLDLEVRIEQKKAKVELGRLPVVEADPTQMRQLLQNLTVNALKFQPPDTIPRVKIYSRPATVKASAPSPLQTVSDRYEIVVEDNGIGFDEKYLDKIFTVFQRLHSRQEYEGTGVGLAICQKIAERHHGQITARSELGKGARFVVTLPVRQIES